METGSDDLTRLDRLWLAVAETGAEADWLRFYEGFAAQRLIVPVVEIEGQGGLSLKTARLEIGEVGFAFDTEARFNAFISRPTSFATMTGAALAAALVPDRIGLALNPGVAPGETVLDADALAWIARYAGAEVSVGSGGPGTEVLPPTPPDPAFLEALGTRVAEFGAHVAEAWLLGTKASRGRDAWLCVVCPGPEAMALADDIATELTRIGQLRAARPFGVAVVAPGASLLLTARQLGIGIAR